VNSKATNEVEKLQTIEKSYNVKAILHLQDTTIESYRAVSHKFRYHTYQLIILLNTNQYKMQCLNDQVEITTIQKKQATLSATTPSAKTCLEAIF
jgi:hypothetical protein